MCCPQGVVLYFQPSVFRCVLLRWVRLLGFATVYGTITLKLYRYGLHVKPEIGPTDTQGTFPANGQIYKDHPFEGIFTLKLLY